MDDTGLRDSLIEQAGKAMFGILEQVNILLEASGKYAARYEKSASKDRELKQSVNDLGSIPRMLVDEIGRWRTGEQRVLSRQGLETFLLADLYASMDAMFWFFQRENIDVSSYSSDSVSRCYYEMIRCNRLL